MSQGTKNNQALLARKPGKPYLGAGCPRLFIRAYLRRE